MRFIPHTFAVTIGAVLAFGCQAATVTGPGWGDLPEGPGGPGVVDPIEPGADPEQVFLEQVLPLLDDRCNDCHTNAATAPVFIDPADPYDSFLASGVVDAGDPGGSTIITKGAHRGPAWQAAELQVVSDWISIEGGVAPGGGGVVDPGGEDPPPEVDPGGDPGDVGDYETTPLEIVDGDNAIDLDDAGLPGAELRFFAQRVALGLHLSSVTIYAGAQGVVVNHPRFVTHDPDRGRMPDPEDRFVGTELVVPADGAAILADNVLLVDFPLAADLSVSFLSTTTL